MRSSAGGLWTTLLMFVPLIAVPAMAIFGVPHADSLKASLDPGAASPPLDLDEPSLGSASKEGSRRAKGDLDGFFPSTKSPFANDGWEDPFLEVSRNLKDDPRRPRPEAPGRGEADEGVRSGANGPIKLGQVKPGDPRFDPFDHAAAPARTADVRDSSSELKAPPNPPKRTVELPREPATPPIASLRDATRRLKELGITEFQLAPGEADNGFVFACQYRSPDNPRITRRFEAEAADELEAVKDVLDQIERFMGKR